MSPALMRLFARLLAEMGQRESSDWDATESALDTARYHDPVRLARERERIFGRLPLCLGHADQLREPGTCIARDVLGLPLLLTRDGAGELHVMLNTCRHRGARLVPVQDEVCHRAGLSCPYHAWTYDLDGRLRGVPRPEAFPTLDRPAHALTRLPVVVRHGLIWTQLDASRETIDVAAFLGGIDADLEALRLDTHRYFRQRVQRRACNWKLMMDAFSEVYHIPRLHGQTIAPFFREMSAAGEGDGLHSRILVGREPLPAARELPPEAWDLRRHATLTHVIFPNSLLIYHPDATSHMAMWPTAPGEILFVHTMFTPHAARSEREQAHWERTFEMIDGGVFSAEDLYISEQVQLGVAAQAGARFVLGRCEQHLRRFHATLDALLQD